MPEKVEGPTGKLKVPRGFFEIEVEEPKSPEEKDDRKTRKPTGPGASGIEDETRGQDKPPRKRGLDRTLTIAKRKLEMYFPTKELKKNVQEKARRKGISASQYILHCVEMADGVVPGHVSKEFDELKKRVAALETEKGALAQENAKLKESIQNYEGTVAILRSRETPIPDHKTEDGISQINKRLVDILRSEGEVKGELLCDLVGFKSNNQVAMRQLRRDIETLISYGLVEPTQEGWKWVR